MVVFGRRSAIKRCVANLSFTVFLPTFNERGAIERKLENVLNQTAFERYDGEVLVYDCSTDNTGAILEDYAVRDPRVRLIRQPTRIGVARTFNEAIDEARGDVLVKTDADSLARSHEELARLLEIFPADNKVGAATGVCANVAREGAFRTLMTKLQIAETNLDSTVIAHSSSMIAIRRTALTRVDPDSMAEDTEEFLRIRRAGLRTILDPSVVSTERIPSKFSDRFEQKQRRAHGIIRALFQNTDMLFNSRYRRYGLIVLPINFFLLTVSPFLLLMNVLALVYLGFTMGVLVGFVVVLTALLLLLVSLFRPSSSLAGLVDLQLFALVGFLNFVSGKTNPTWKVHRT